MEQNYNKLTPAETERLSLLLEEMGECQQIIGKILRHGYESYNPNDKEKTTNRELLEMELAHVSVACCLVEDSGDIDGKRIDKHVEEKESIIKKYLHHQEQCV